MAEGTGKGGLGLGHWLRVSSRYKPDFWEYRGTVSPGKKKKKISLTRMILETERFVDELKFLS